MLHYKMWFALALLVAALLVCSQYLMRETVVPAFDDFEVELAEQDLRRASVALQADFDTVTALNADWAAWDDMYHYVNRQNATFQRATLARVPLTKLGLDLLAVYGPDGGRMWADVRVNEEAVRADTFNILDPDNPLAATLISHATTNGRTAGFVQTIAGPMLISSRPVLRSDESGPPAGAVVVGRFLNAARLQDLRDRTGVDLRWIFADTQAASRPGVDATRTAVIARRTLPDIYGKPFLTLETVTPRQVSVLGEQSVAVVSRLLLFAGLALVVLLAGLLTWQIERLRLRVGREETATGRDAARDARTNDMAGVMHNIRNAMTPMINGLQRLQNAMQVSRSLRVTEALDVLDSDTGSRQSSGKYLEYLRASFRHIEKTERKALQDLEVVTSQARLIEGILGDQEKSAGAAPRIELLPIEELLGEASHVIPPSSPAEISVVVGDGLRDCRIRASRTSLLQVLGNLVLNAYESILRSGRGAGKILLQAVPESVNDQPMVRVTVRDDGAGFDEDTGEHIFDRGYSSKQQSDNHGLGLHWCRTAVSGMGGSINAASDGIGRGAEFHLLLPQAGSGEAA